MRLVVDTNLIVSGLISPGLPRQLLEAARAGAFELCTSETLLAELLRVLGRAKFSNRLGGRTPEDIVADLRQLAVVATPTNVPRVVLSDPDDDHVLAAALAGAADLIASGTGTTCCRWAAMPASISSPRAKHWHAWQLAQATDNARSARAVAYLVHTRQRGAGKSITLLINSRISVMSGRASSRRHCTV